MRKTNATIGIGAAVALALSAAIAPTVAAPTAAAPTAVAPTTAAPAAPTAKRELVPWIQDGDYASLLTRAKKQKKLVFLDLYAVWCGPCKQMDRITYTDSTVAAVAGAHYLSRKVDGEKGEGIVLAKRFNINSYPTLLVVDGDCKEVNRAVGFRTPDRFARFLDDTRTGRGTIAGLESSWPAGRTRSPTGSHSGRSISRRAIW